MYGTFMVGGECFNHHLERVTDMRIIVRPSQLLLLLGVIEDSHKLERRIVSLNTVRWLRLQIQKGV